MVYFGVFLVLPNSMRFTAFYSKIPYFKSDILSPYLYLHTPYLYFIYGWLTRVAQSMMGVGREVKSWSSIDK